MNFYLPDECGVPVLVPMTPENMAKLEDESIRRVAKTVIKGQVNVSTVFLFFDHNYGGGMPILYETMVFADRFGKYTEFDEVMYRYYTKEQALLGHREMCQRIGIPESEITI